MTTECAANVARDINIYMIDLHPTTTEAPNAPERNHEERVDRLSFSLRATSESKN